MNDGDLDRTPNMPGVPALPQLSGPCTINIPCYEGPDGRGPGTISLSEEALTRHIFVAGATGAGKTTLLRAIMRQLIGWNAKDGAKKVGLVVLDFKGDDTVDFVRAAAAAAGRESDVRVLSLDSTMAYDFFGDCRSTNEAAEYAQRLTFGCGRVEQANNFWDQYRDNLLRAALTWLATNHSADRSFSRWITHASSWLLADSLPADMRDDLKEFRRRCENLLADSPEKIATRHALQLVENWGGIGAYDSRTRANIQAVIDLAMRPLMEPAVLRLFRDATAKKFRVASAVQRGRILVVSTSSFLHPELASLVARCVKADYYKAVFSRQPGGRLAMLIGDEYHLAVTSGNARYDDCHALPLMRSQRAGLVVATQTLAGMDRVVGHVNRRVLLGNFGTVFFLRSTEPEVEAWAQQLCGSVEETVTERLRVRDSRTAHRLAEEYEQTVTRQVRRAICGPGALARLEPGQAYLLMEGSATLQNPIWLAGEP